MSNGTRVLRGVAHGKTIELEQELDLPDGQAVQLEIRPVEPAPAWMERIVLDPTTDPGQPIIKGTGIKVEQIVALLDQGRTDEELRRTYPDLALEDLAAVRRYAQIPPTLRRLFGAWHDEAEALDEYLEWNRQQRKIGRREVEE